MPNYPKHTARYPSEFREAWQAAFDRGEFFFPCSNPDSIRPRLWAFAKALRTEGESSFADAIEVSLRPGGILLRRKDRSEAATAIAQALKTLPPTPGAAEEALERLFK